MIVKQASDANAASADRLLQRIHAENPSYWPYGLSRAHFDGGLYLLSKQAGMEPVGFVGWQEREESGRRVGYYSVGILPEHRRRDYAKRAVQTLLTEKSAGVDEVRAMVMRTNEPSKQLARSLDGVVLLEKAAAAKTILTGLLGGTGTMLLQDNQMNPDEPLGTQAFNFDENSKGRNLMNVVNFALGAGGATFGLGGLRKMRAATTPGASAIGLAQAGAGAGGMIAGPIYKDVAMDSHKAIHGIHQLSKDLPAAVEASKFKLPTSLVAGGLGLGAAGIGAASILAWMKIRAEEKKAEAARGGRIRVTLPTKNPGDSETTIDLPTEGFDMSAALQGKLKRDTKRRLLLETRQRTQRRKPLDPDNLTAAELEDQQLELERQQLELEHGPIPKNFRKAASLSSYFKQAGAAPAVPSPPAQGTNPALRMTQEAQTAQAAAQGASTDANPQIQQAQAAASAAEQKAQQDIAAAQQSSQQEAMQRDQSMQQELAKKDQEVFQARQEIEIQKTQVEKAKVEMELAKAKMVASKELEDNKKSMTDSLANGESSAVNRMTKKRLARIRSSVSKIAAFNLNAAPGLPSTSQTAPAAPVVKEFIPGTAQRINDNGNEFQAMGGLARSHTPRTSYGKLGDTAYGMFARPFLMTPSLDNASDWNQMSPESIAANPDAFDSLMRGGMSMLHAPR